MCCVFVEMCLFSSRHVQFSFEIFILIFQAYDTHVGVS